MTGKGKRMEFRKKSNGPIRLFFAHLAAHAASPLRHPAFTAINLAVAFGPTSPASTRPAKCQRKKADKPHSERGESRGRNVAAL